MRLLHLINQPAQMWRSWDRGHQRETNRSQVIDIGCVAGLVDRCQSVCGAHSSSRFGVPLQGLQECFHGNSCFGLWGVDVLVLSVRRCK